VAFGLPARGEEPGEFGVVGQDDEVGVSQATGLRSLTAVKTLAKVFPPRRARREGAWC
jgi:hypothetical protein